ncbi:hypothetical protein LFZ31_27305, partial [Salmonella enterica subsp. enterica serovar Newport str. S09097]
EIGVDISGFATTAERLGQEGKIARSMRLLTVNWRRLSPWPIRSNPVTPAAINALHQLGINGRHDHWR